MYQSCWQCHRAFGRNEELASLPVGQRVAFDAKTGRVWVVCRHCGLWNLVPIEERWEAIEECERLSATAEVRTGRRELGLAKTSGGLEMLRIGGLEARDIANWRYGRRQQARQRAFWLGLAAIACLAAIGGVVLGRAAHQPVMGAYAMALLGFYGYAAWREPPVLWITLPRPVAGRRRWWRWHLSEVRWGSAGDPPGTIWVPAAGGGWEALHGNDALAFLAEVLPRLNAIDVGPVRVEDAVARVERAEHTVANPPQEQPSRRRRVVPKAPPPTQAWHALARPGVRVFQGAARDRIALEMAVTEERERLAFDAQARAHATEWLSESGIAAIADELVEPPGLAEHVRALKSPPADDS